MTAAESIILIRGHLAYLAAHGFDIHVVSGAGPRLRDLAGRGVTTHESSLSRSLVPTRDAAALLEITRLFRRLRPDVVHAGTPKAGLIGMIAASLARVPARVYQIHGLPYLTARGPLRTALRAADRVASRLAHSVLCNSASNREIVVAEGLCPAHKIKVLGAGSAAGVDARGEFDPARHVGSRLEVRRHFAIPASAPVLGFVGRLATDKGVDTLFAAWQRLRDSHADAHLLLVGGVDERQPIPARLLAEMERDPRVHIAGAVEGVARWFAAMDVFALPTLREGFSGVCLEAAAMRLPVVTTRVPGALDAVLEGRNGELVPASDPARLVEALARYLDDPALRERHGAAGRSWVLEAFEPERISAELLREYERLGATKVVRS